jgi:TolA-binding protein
MKNIIIILNILLSFFIIEISLYSQTKDEKENLSLFSDNVYFENANQLYKLKNYDKALEYFQEYLEIYIGGIHRKEAYKYIADIYFQQFLYIKSIKAYNALHEEYSGSEEGIEAYYMTGICYQKMGLFDRAKNIFKSVIEEHPESNYSFQSRIKLDMIDIISNR